MVVKIRTLPDTYQDSVKLMRIASDTAESLLVGESVAMMGTEENKESLVQLGIIEPGGLPDVSPDDLILAAKDDDPEKAEEAMERMADAIEGSQAQQEKAESRGERPPKSLYKAITELPGANLALISTPGEYATREAWKALHEGLNVHIFSDNVGLEDERKLKTFARENDLLVMGPDSGSAIINQAPLGFANSVDDGAVGVVSASGSGLQEVTALLDRAGAGISQAIGTGGRDLKDEIGGVTMSQGLEMLTEDDETEVILLVSKPPDEDTMEELLDQVSDCPKPVVVEFVGSDPDPIESAGAVPATSLADSARRSAALLPDGPAKTDVSFGDGIQEFTPADVADEVVSGRSDPGDREYLRGLFSGGTLSSEAVTLLDIPEVASNLGVGDQLEDSLDPAGHAIVDLGADEFTRGRPHPMIDSSIRDEQLRAALTSDDVLVVLLDVILGYGAHDDPAGTLVDVLEDVDTGDWPVVISSVVGTRGDPQSWPEQVSKLTDAGVYVAESNAAAVHLAKGVLAEANGGESE